MSIDQSVPMWRFTDRMVRSGLVIAWRLATSPTRTSPVFENATTDGVVRPPSELGATTGSPASRTATTELVVPRSIPTALDMSSCLLEGGLYANDARSLSVWVSTLGFGRTFPKLDRQGYIPGHGSERFLRGDPRDRAPLLRLLQEGAADGGEVGRPRDRPRRQGGRLRGGRRHRVLRDPRRPGPRSSATGARSRRSAPAASSATSPSSTGRRATRA